jgi:hypothetical protein
VNRPERGAAFREAELDRSLVNVPEEAMKRIFKAELPSTNLFSWRPRLAQAGLLIGMHAAVLACTAHDPNSSSTGNPTPGAASTRCSPRPV